MGREANENIELLFKMHEENEGWFYTNLKELGEKYGDKFLAIKDKNVLIATDTIDKIPSFLEKSIDVNRIFITSITPKGVASFCEGRTRQNPTKDTHTLRSAPTIRLNRHKRQVPYSTSSDFTFSRYWQSLDGTNTFRCTL
ncbi:MAG: hypothetical protein HA494_04430 [Thaumarchaeota archaeon]|nr:hypothetical protein [Nitrososphaerota archaeon]